jgi:hypothetical protein
MLPVSLSDGIKILSYPPCLPAIQMLFSAPVFVYYYYYCCCCCWMASHNALGERKDSYSLIFDCRHKDVLFR